MLYQIYDAQRAILEPFADLAHATAKMFTSSAYPLSHIPGSERIAAGYELFHRLGKDYEKPEFGIQQIEVDGQEVAIFERIEIDKPFCELRRFKRFSDDAQTLDKLKGQPTVLIVAPLSGHYATLLRDTVRTMLVDHKVYITDWRNARLVPTEDGEFHLDDYIAYVQEFIRHLIAKYDHCHVLAVCQPTVPVLAAVSLMASHQEQLPLSMTLMGGPLDARKSPTAVDLLATERSHEWFMNNVIYRVPPGYPGEGRKVYPGFLQHAGFVSMNPDRHTQSHYDFFQHLIAGNDESADAHRKFYDEYNAVLDMDAAYYLETIATVFQKFSLVNGDWDVLSPEGKTERVKPADITTAALLTVEGELDDITGPGQSEAAHGMCANIPAQWKQHLMVEKAGHYGIFSGRRWREIAYPAVRAFIAQAHQRGAANYKATGQANPYNLDQAKAAYAAKNQTASAFNDANTTSTAAMAPTVTVAAPSPTVVQSTKPVTKPEVKPAAKPAVKRTAPTARKAATPVVKAPAKPAAVKPAAAKPAAVKPAAVKPAVVKPAVKAAAEPAAKTAAKVAENAVAKPVTTSTASPVAPVAATNTPKVATKRAAS
jgi:poly(3-hydroxybutyrate) depolymerase